MANLLVGPLLRYVGSTQATVWVETDAPCEVTVLGHRERTFHVEGHHYALVVIDDLEPATVTPYDVRLDGQQVWPPGGRTPAEHDLHAEPRASGAPRVRLVPGRRAGGPAVHALELRAPEGGRDRRALGVLEATAEASGSRGRTPAAARRPGLRRRGLARDARVRPLAARRVAAAGRAGRRLRGVHAAVPRVVGRPRHPLAALDGAERR